MSSPTTAIPWETCLLEPVPDAALEAHARRVMGSPHPSLRYFSRSPWLARALVDWLPEYGLLTELEGHTSDLIGLIVSQENSCRYCYAASRALLRIQGMSQARLDRLEQQMLQLDVDPRLAAVVRYARQLSRCDPPPDATAVQRLREAGYSPMAIREIAFAVTCTVMFNRINTMAATPPQEFERLPEMILVRCLRPLIAWSIGRQRHRGQVAGSRPAVQGLGAQLVAACGASPIATALAGTLEGIQASTELDTRSKLLIFAVIARGLGCRSLERETAPLLLSAGEPETLLPQVLAHLDAPQLTPLQRRLVGFARETIWYEPPRLQRLARELRAELSAGQFTEALGLMAVANALCRLDLALQLVDD